MHFVKTITQLIAQGQQADKRLVNIDSSTLFYRLILPVERCSDVAHYFQYELNTTPCSLFHGYVMNKAIKSSVIKTLKVNL